MGELDRHTPSDAPTAPSPADAPDATLDPAAVAALYVEHATELRRFVLGVLRDPDLTGDVLQATFARAVEQGGATRAETRKGWLFRVALHEALAARRRQGVRDRANRRLTALWTPTGERPEESLIRGETVEAVRQALERLPAEQRQVVRARIDEDKTFAQIAAELNLPLGTVLTRMRLALAKLRRGLETGDER
jgi:RNA polymerase sigma-70 factor (ECF subfamily)